MNLKSQPNLSIFISLLCLAAFGVMALLVSKHTIDTFDSIIISYVQGAETPILTNIMKFFTYIGGTMAVVVLSIVTVIFLSLVWKHYLQTLLFIVVMMGANILFVSLKLLFHRERPDLHRLVEASYYSFPSGHATMSFALYGCLSFLLWRNIASQLGRIVIISIAGLFILTIGLSRIYLGVHYPSDVIAGYCISAFWLLFCIWFFQRISTKQL